MWNREGEAAQTQIQNYELWHPKVKGQTTGQGRRELITYVSVTEESPGNLFFYNPHCFLE